MNEYLQKYLEKRKAEEQKEHQKQVIKLVNDLRIGEVEYSTGTDYDREDFPYYDPKKGKYYRYTIGELTNEEYDLLVKENDKKPTEIQRAEPEISGWKSFAIVMIVLGGLAVLISFFVTLSGDSYDRNWSSFFIILGSFLMELGFWAIVILLTEIKLGIDTLISKQ